MLSIFLVWVGLRRRHRTDNFGIHDRLQGDFVDAAMSLLVNAAKPVDGLISVVFAGDRACNFFI